MENSSANSSKIKLWIIFGLFIGLIVGLIVYEVKQYVIARETIENNQAIRKKEMEIINNAIQKSISDSSATQEGQQTTDSL